MRPLLLIAALAGAAFALPDPQPTVALDMPVGDPQTTQTVHVHPKPCGGLKAKYCSWVLGGPGTTFTTTITNITTTTLTKLAVSIEHTTNPVSTVKDWVTKTRYHAAVTTLPDVTVTVIPAMTAPPPMDRKIGERAIEGDDPESCDPGWWPWSSYCSCALETDNCDPTITEYAPTLETRLIVTTATVLTITRSDDLPAVTETGTTTLTTTYTTYKLYGSTVTTTVSP